jgi:hypothetical protein
MMVAMATTSDPLHAGPADPEVPSPVLANLVVLIGFAVVFTTFATGSAWSWIIGGALVLAGGLWAGFTGPRPTVEHGHGRTG